MGDRDPGAWQVVAPASADAPTAPTEHFKLGRPAGTWTYHDANGDVLGYVMRFDTEDGKIFLPLTYCKHSHHGRVQWRWKAWPPPRPLYGLDRLAARPEAPVLVVEGEKAADAAADLLPDYVVITSPNGSNAAGKAGWIPLAQRRVAIWPDADPAGDKYVADVAKALGALGMVDIQIINPPEGIANGWDAHDALTENWTPARALALVAAARPAAQALQETHGSTKRTPADRPRKEDEDQGRAQDSDGRRGKRPPQRDSLVKIGAAAGLWHSPEREGFATVEVEGHMENWPLRSRDFRYWLAGRYYDLTGGAPGGQALADALAVLEQMALRGPEHQPHLRVAGADGKVYLDLGDFTWRAIEVTAEGWEVVAAPPVKFIRSPAMLPLPEPEGGASIDILRNFINVASEHDFRLLVGFVVGVLQPNGPFPILCLVGEPRTGKTMIARMLSGLVDPRRAALRSLPKDPRDLAIAAFNGRLLLFDNISHLSEELADALCRLSSGTGFATRTLHSDRDETIFDGARPIVLNGIPNVAATRADLTDRALTITLAPIPPGEGRSESALLADFEAARPEILGAILTAVSSALRNVATVEIAHHERMIDFSMWVTASEAGLGWEPGTFVAAYRANQAGNVELAVESDTVASAVVALCERVSLPWQGNATELLAELDLEVNEKVRASRAWPSSALAFGNRLRRCTPMLRAIGIEVEVGGRATTKDRKRLIVIHRRG